MRTDVSGRAFIIGDVHGKDSTSESMSDVLSRWVSEHDVLASRPAIFVSSDMGCDFSLALSLAGVREDSIGLIGVIDIDQGELSLSFRDEILSRLTRSGVNFPSVAGASGVERASSRAADAYIVALADAERSLVDSGTVDFGDRVHALRGIYYGTPWSMDHGQMESGARNLAFNVYTASDEPVDIRPIIGQSVFEQLRSDPEPILGGVPTDIGHILIGIDARERVLARSVSIPMHGPNTGLELVTWIGDLGGAAGKLALDRIKRPNVRAKTKFDQRSNFGGYVNFESNVNAYTIGVPAMSGCCSRVDVEDGVMVFDVLRGYFDGETIEEQDAFEQRYSTFASMIGCAEIPEDVMSSPCAADIAHKIEEFAELYMINWVNSDGGVDVDVTAEASRHLEGAAEEVTSIFLDVLRRMIAGEASRPTAVLDPPVSEPRSPYVKHSIGKALKQAREDLLERIGIE